MAPKGGTCCFLLILACAALAKPPEGNPDTKSDIKDISRKLMKKCLKNGYPEPKMLPITPFKNCDLAKADSMVSGSSNKDPQVDVMTNKKCLLATIEQMRNSSMASSCHTQAIVASISWEMLTKQSENMTSEEYDTLLEAYKPALGMKLPSDVGERQNLEKWIDMLKGAFVGMSEDQTTQVVKWEKEQIMEKYFNCTTRPEADQRSSSMERCNPKRKWLNSDTLKMMGPYIAKLAPMDVDSAPKKELCEFFSSQHFKNATNMVSNMNPSLGRKFFKRFEDCFGKEGFSKNVDKLGILACHVSNALDLDPDISQELLSELDSCDDGNPRIKQMKKRLVKAVFSTATGIKGLEKLDKSLAFLTPSDLFNISKAVLKDIIKDLGFSVQWTRAQMRAIGNKLQDKKCNKRMSGKDLLALKSVAEGLPRCAFKHVKEILNDTEGMKNIAQRMRKGQRMDMLQELLEDVAPSLLVQKLSGRLLGSLPLSRLVEANIVSLDQVGDKTWSRSQAAFLAKKILNGNKFWYRVKKLRSVMQGITCEMIDDVSDSDTGDMGQAVTEDPQWLSKRQAGCAARKRFASLEKERPDYFKNITEEEMKNISTCLLLRLPPLKVEDLPDSVCPTLLDKIEEADLSSLPQRSLSRPTFTKRALRCLANGTDLSMLTKEDVSRLGPFLCELSPAQLKLMRGPLMAPEVLKSSLRAMASCQHIPRRHVADLVQLVSETFGDPSNWSAETMEELGALVLLDENKTSTLPNKPWLKDVLYFLKSKHKHTSKALGKKIFDLTTTASNATRKKRAVEQVTTEMIEELGMNNVYWSVEQLDGMSDKTFLATVETLGDVPDYNADQLAVLKSKTDKNLVPEITESKVKQLGCLTRGFPSEDLEKLPFLLDTLEETANCGWTESQMESVWKGASKYNSLTAKQLKAADMVMLSRFICGLDSTEIRQLNIDAFKDAVGSVGSVACSYSKSQELKRLAVSAFGNPNSWDEAQVSELGNIAAGLDATEFASLKSSVFSFISKPCIALIPPRIFASLNVDQLLSLGPDNAAMVTSGQKAEMKDEQLAALERAATGSTDQEQRIDRSGAPSMSVEGISAFMMPLLFLLMGLLLL
ncbi:otoancorin [Notothenia coriiceps]|uniref:Otoancorin n=1 Tax=Notothenia coriiceps TaxID=8208 RepID=A0A6I9PHQ2_9TELE|nr:PREDICTED: otoancorin [Notothenia coriiceps]